MIINKKKCLKKKRAHNQFKTKISKSNDNMNSKLIKYFFLKNEINSNISGPI